MTITNQTVNNLYFVCLNKLSILFRDETKLNQKMNANMSFVAQLSHSGVFNKYI